jgi:hypothetical protein
MGVAALAVLHICGGNSGGGLATLAAVAVAAAVYVIAILKLKAILPSEIATLPKGEKLLELLVRLRLVKDSVR